MDYLHAFLKRAIYLPNLRQNAYEGNHKQPPLIIDIVILPKINDWFCSQRGSVRSAFETFLRSIEWFVPVWNLGYLAPQNFSVETYLK